MTGFLALFLVLHDGVDVVQGVKLGVEMFMVTGGEFLVGSVPQQLVDVGQLLFLVVGTLGC